MGSEELSMAAVADPNFQDILPLQGLKVYEEVKGDALPWSKQSHALEEAAIDLQVKFPAEFLARDCFFPIVSHRVGFPPSAIQLLPATGLLGAGWQSRGIIKSFRNIICTFFHLRDPPS
jgi:hypothetical protein